MKNLIIVFLILGLNSCSVTVDNLCEYEGYQVISTSAEESSCGCGPAHEIQLMNSHTFKNVAVNEGVWKYYSNLLKQAQKDSTVVTIVCKETVMLKEN